jgi:hypothetical protein
MSIGNVEDNLERRKDKKLVKKRGENDTYLTHICRLLQIIESLGRTDKKWSF